MAINRDTSVEELTALVSQALESAGIKATLSGGGAVCVYTMNEYESDDLDFVTSDGQRALAAAVEPLGFCRSKNPRQFEHPQIHWFVEFPPGPLAFGGMFLMHEDLPILNTPFGPLRIITPTLSILDRLVAYYSFNDNQCWDQATMIARRQKVDWDAVHAWVETEGRPPSDVDRLRERAKR